MQQTPPENIWLHAARESAFHPFAVLSAICNDAGHVVDFRYEFANHAALETYQVTREWLIGKHLRVVLPDEQLFHACRQVLELGFPWEEPAYAFAELTSPLIHSQSHFHIRVTKLDDGVAMAWQDVTSQLDLTKRLREREEWQQLIIDNVEEYAILTLDRAGRISSWNPGAERILGYQEDEALGQTVAIIFTPEDRAAGVPEREIRNAITQGRGVDERWHLRNDGSRFWASGMMMPLYAPDEQLQGFTKILRDNTARREAEETQARLLKQLEEEQTRLNELNDTLENRVLERTQQVQGLASELTFAEQQERRRIAQVLHDDLQQLLYALDMRIGLLATTSAPEQTAALSELQDIVRDALTTIRTLTINLSPPVLQEENFGKALAWLADQMATIHHLHVTFDIQDDVRVPRAEMRGLLFQIVRELLFNVVKHAGVDAAAITLRREQTDLIITVADRGRGFMATPDATQRATGGFGLYSTRQRLDLFGGRIEITSLPGSGAQVEVFVPLAALDHDE